MLPPSEVADASLTARVAPLPEARAERIALEHWGVEATARRVAGEKDDNFILHAPDPRYVLKVVHPAEPAAITDHATALLARLGNVPGVPTEALVPTTAGAPDVLVEDLDGPPRRARLTTFLSGRLLRGVPSTPALRENLGAAQARLARALGRLPGPAEPRALLWDLWQADRVRPMLDALGDLPDRRWLDEVLARFAADTRPRLADLRRQLVHNDFSADNVLVADDGTTVAGIVDFGDVIVTQLVNDVAIAMVSQLADDDDPLAPALDLLRGYHAVTPLERDEVELLYDLVRLRVATRLVISEWRARAHPGNRDYILRNTAQAWRHAGLLPVAAGPETTRRLLAACGLDQEKAMHASGAMPNSFDAAAASALPERDQALIARRRRVLGPGYKLFYRRPLELVRGQGVHVYDRDGTEYLDAYNNVPCVGHAEPTVVAAVAERMAALNTNTRYLDERILDYAERLLATHDAGLGTVMFACTGSEANDLALRIARHATGATGVVISANAYHGLTSAVAEISPSLGANEPLGLHVRAVAPPAPGEDAEQAGPAFAARVAAAIDDLRRHGAGTAAVVMDTVFSSDGLRPGPAGFLAPVAEVARARGALFVADEVQAGFARTGEAMWGYARHGVAPDLVTMGKPMGNGVPIAAVAARPELIERFGAEVRYFNTFGGNSVAIAAAAAVLDVLERDALMANARDVGARLLAGVRRLADGSGVLGDVRGVGLYLAADGADAKVAGRVVNGLRDRRVLISASGADGATLKIRPPLLFSDRNADRLLEALADVLADPALEG